jgi:redox-sensitive bicupin YhaK (pirin superfamily)
MPGFAFSGGGDMITIRKPEEIYRIEGDIENGTFHGRWHFSFGDYHDAKYVHFGALRVFNDDTLSPGAVWPLHPHRDNEVVTYCASGEFRHADERGAGGVLRKGWVQHTTVGTGMWHSEINNLPDQPMRFIQMWFLPSERGRKPSVEQKAVEKAERTNRFFPLVSNKHSGALRIISDAEVYSSFIQKGESVRHPLPPGRGVYLYVLEGGPLRVNGLTVPALGAVMAADEDAVTIIAETDSEMLLVDVNLA